MPTESKSNIPDNLATGYVHELEGIEQRLRRLGKPDDSDSGDVKRQRDNLTRRADEIADAIGGKTELAKARKAFGRVDGNGKPVERAVPDDGDKETRKGS